MGAFEGRHDPLLSSQQIERGHGFVVGHRSVFGSALIPQITVFGTDRGVVQPGGNRMSQINLSVVTLEQIGHGALQDAWLSSGKTCGMLSTLHPQAAGFDANHLHVLVPDERMEESHGIAATADAGNEVIRQPAFCRQDLSPSFTSDDGLEVSDHHRIGMGSEN